MGENKLFRFVTQSMPFQVFMLVVFLNELEIGQTVGASASDWTPPFQAAGATAAVQIVFYLANRWVLDRMFLGINLFFIGGSAAYSLELPILLDLYLDLLLSMPFVTLVLVGIGSTLWTRIGFQESTHQERRVVIARSALLTAVTLACLVFSYFFRTEPARGFIGPMVFVLGTRRLTLR